MAELIKVGFSMRPRRVMRMGRFGALVTFLGVRSGLPVK